MADDARGPPLPWIVQWAGLVTPGSTVLDLAAGGGRHTLFFAERNHKVLAVDRDTSRQPVAALPAFRRGDRDQLPAPPADAGTARRGRTRRRSALPDLHGRQRTLRSANEPGASAARR